MSAVGSSAAPVRTCIGCRRRAPATELLRVVVACGANGHDTVGPAGEVARGPLVLSVVPDPRRRAPGRGAWLHPVPGCVELAERRRAFVRAFRTSGRLDPAPVRAYVVGRPGQPASGTPQE